LILSLFYKLHNIDKGYTDNTMKYDNLCENITIPSVMSAKFIEYPIQGLNNHKTMRGS